jgi:hypothetical protein
MATLQERAKALLARPIPSELAPDYVPNSMADIFIAAYAKNGALDDEALEMIGLCAMEAASAAESYKTDEARAYFIECAAVLTAIEEESGA